MSTRVDYIIAGLGLSGAAIACQLLRRGKSIAVFDTPESNRSSHQAAGLFNPISGQKLTKAWMADELFPSLHKFYTDIEQRTSEKFFHPSRLFIPFRSVAEQNDWAGADDVDHIETVFTSTAFGDQVYDELGGLLLNSGGYLHVRNYLTAVQRLIKEKNMVRHALDTSKLRFTSDSVRYEDLQAQGIIFCDGLASRKNPLTSWLPIRPLKGESIDLDIDVELRVIFNRGIYIVPMGHGKYRAGATYERTEDPGTTARARRDLEERLKGLLRVSFSITGQDWGVRPTVPDRRPVLGPLPDHPQVFVFNGMGTKGVSLTPYFSEVLVNCLEGGGQIPREVNISRFYTLSSRSAD